MSGAMLKLAAIPPLVWTALVVLTLAACGVPATSPPTAITQVPYNLMETAVPPTPQRTTPARRGPFIYWLNATDQLTATEAGTMTSDAADAAAAVLSGLAQGPSEPERLIGVSTALGPDVSLTVNRVEGGRADIDVQIGPRGPSARRLPLAVGQIVLSLTSISGIDSVWLMSDGTPIEAPLPDGALTARPLTAQDFTALVAGGAGGAGGAGSPTGRAT
jgi:Sporulation and spore germination.